MSRKQWRVRRQWRVMASAFAIGAAVGAAGATAMRRSRWDGDGPATMMDLAHQGLDPLLNSTLDEAWPNDTGTRTPGLAVPMSAADGNSPSTSSPTGV